MKKKRPIRVRPRAFHIWQELGFFPWRKEKKARKERKRDFYKGAFDDIPFLNDDAKRTFAHLLLRPGYMIRDYMSGQHERYLAPLTALIIFYAFFGLISAVLQPIQQQKENPFEKIDITIKTTEKSVEEYRAEKGEAEELQQTVLLKTYKLLRAGYLYLHLDEFPEEVDTRHEASIAAFEGKLRSQGIPLFLGKFLLLWLAMWLSLRWRGLSLSASAAAAAYILCQFCFFMFFVLIISLGQKMKIGFWVTAALIVWDYSQLFGVNWKKSLRLAAGTGLAYVFIYAVIFALLILALLLATRIGT